MQIDTAGTYTLKYTAEDACGNITEVTREVVAEQISYRTVLYTDGTFIINESSRDQAANEALHGVATNVYYPFDPNGITDAKRYIFANQSERPWNNERQNIKSVKIGSVISPTNTNLWFSSTAAIDIDLTNLDTSNVTEMMNMFSNCPSLTSLDLGDKFDTSNVTSMAQMFVDCSSLTSLDLGDKFDTSNVTDMTSMFTNDLSLVTILVPATFVVSQVTSSANMFTACSVLVGGAGTTYNRNNPKDKTYARIDNPPDAPGYFTLKTA